MLLKIFAQMLLVALLVVLWLLTLTAIGVVVSFTNGTSLRLRGWWLE